MIRDGIPVTVKKPNGQTETKKATVIDFQNPEKNYFLAIKELKIHGDLYRRRTDIVGFVNGIPLLFVELKKNTVDVQNAYDDNYTDYLDTIPHLFYYNAFLMLSNGMEAKVGTLGSKFEFFQCSILVICPFISDRFLEPSDIFSRYILPFLWCIFTHQQAGINDFFF